MRVLLVTGSAPPMVCGVGDYTTTLAHALVERTGIEVAILTGVEAAGATMGEGVTLFPVMSGWDWSDAKTLRRVIREWRPDIVHVQYPTQGYRTGKLPDYVPLIAKLSGRKVVRTWHEDYSLGNLPKFAAQLLAPGRSIAVRPNYRRRLPKPLSLLLTGRTVAFVPIASAIPPCALPPAELQAVRERWRGDAKRLIVFFGFLYRFKGAELLFDIADPATDRLVFAGEAKVDPGYGREIEERGADGPWKGRVTVTGFLPDDETAALLAAADAVVLPFRRGGGIWNSSAHAAAAQGTPVITTSRERTGFDEERMIHYSRPDDVADMKAALDRLAGQRRALPPLADRDEWTRIVSAHMTVYEGRPLGGLRA